VNPTVVVPARTPKDEMADGTLYVNNVF